MHREPHFVLAIDIFSSAPSILHVSPNLVHRTQSKSALTNLSLSLSPPFCQVFNFLGSASTPAIARALHLDAAGGSRNSTQAAAVAGRFVWLAILIGIAVGGLMLVSVDRLLGWMMVSQAQLCTTRRLARLRAVGAPLELVSMALRGLLSGCGDTSSQLRATIAECLTQTAISTILIKHLGWGVEAVGVGLLTSHVFSTVMLATRLRRHVAVNLGLASLPAPALLWQCLADCSPLVCRTFCLHGLLTSAVPHRREPE